MVSYLAFQGNLLLTINQSSLWMPKVDIFVRKQANHTHQEDKDVRASQCPTPPEGVLKIQTHWHTKILKPKSKLDVC
jgi:hypothetical protein